MYPERPTFGRGSKETTVGPRAIKDDYLVGASIRAARLAAGTPQRRLASALGVCVQQIAKYERGQARVSVGQIVAISRTLRTPVAWIIDEARTVPPARRPLATSRLIATSTTST